MSRITAPLYEHQYTSIIIARSFLLRMRHVSAKLCRDNQYVNFTFNNVFRILCRCVINDTKHYDILWKNVLDPERPHMTIWHMSVTYWIPKVTNTHWHYALLIAFRLQQMLNASNSMLSYTYIFWIYTLV